MRLIAYLSLEDLAAAVEGRERLRERGRPLAVTTQAGRWVLAASAEARERGISRGMGVWEARYRCPELICVPERPEKYEHYWQRVLEVVGEYTPIVERAEREGLWAELTGTELLFGTARGVCERMLRRLKREMGVGGSAGIGPNKLTARMAASLAETGRVQELGERGLAQEVAGLPLGMLPGLSARMRSTIGAMGLRTLGELAAVRERELLRAFGEEGQALAKLARGEDEEPVRPCWLPEVRRLEELLALEPGTDDPRRLRAGALLLCERLAGRLRARAREAGALQVRLGFRNHREAVFIRRLARATCLEGPLFRAAEEVMDRLRLQGRQVCLLTLAAVGLRREPAGAQLELELGGGGHELGRRLAGAVDAVRERYGEWAIGRAGTWCGEGGYRLPEAPTAGGEVRTPDTGMPCGPPYRAERVAGPRKREGTACL